MSADNPKSVVRQWDPRKRSIAIKLSIIARQLWQRFDQSVERDGLTRAKWSLIGAVASNPGVTQRSIATMLEITEVTAGQLIDRLCTDGYLERRENLKDRRAYCIYPTPAAKPVLEKLGAVANIHENETFSGLTNDDLACLDTLLDVIARNIASSRSRDEAKKSAGNPASVAE